MNPYIRGPYNKMDDTEQWIRISEGCPNNCEFCRETKECGKEPIYLDIPKIERNIVKIMDMNLLYKPKAIEILNFLGSQKVNNKNVYYELICGIDYRYLNLDLALALKRNHFVNIRFAWDHSFALQKQINKAIELLVKAGYSRKKMMCFILCNWKISHKECNAKLDLLKVWNVKVADCWYDNQVSPNIKPIYWTPEQILDFRGLRESKCRVHNGMVTFDINPFYRENITPSSMNIQKSLNNISF